MKTYRLKLCAALLLSGLASYEAVQGQPGALREVWTHVTGRSVSDLEALEAYPDQPLFAEVIPTLQTPSSWGNYYGQRVRALLTPTSSGTYIFWVAGDDGSELWLSSDENPENRTRIARVSGWTSSEEWNKEEGQRSEEIQLEAGQSYYLEALQKEHSGGDHLAVAWSHNGGALEIIGRNHLTVVGDVKAPAASGLLVEAGASKELYDPALSMFLHGQVHDATSIKGSYSAEWSVTSGTGVIIDTPEELTAEATFPGPGDYTLTLTITKGELTESDSLSVKVYPALDPEAGKATQQFWFDVRGEEVADLKQHLDFPLHPHMTRDVTALEGPNNFLYYYGTRTIGYLLAPRTGSYRFFVSGDDTAAFYLSTNANAKNTRLIAQATSATGRGDFFVDPAQQISDPIQLTKGQRYFFELLHKEHGSNDHHAVY